MRIEMKNRSFRLHEHRECGALTPVRSLVMCTLLLCAASGDCLEGVGGYTLLSRVCERRAVLLSRGEIDL